MSNEETFKAELSETLAMIDVRLAANDLPVTQRPFHAARMFSEIHIGEVAEGERRWTPDFTSTDFVTEGWFKTIFAETYAWYRERYPDDIDRSSLRMIKALVLIWNTPFLMEVPASTSQPGEPGKTIWVAFPDSVSAEEDPMMWLVSPPNLTNADPRVRESTRLLTIEIAAAVRRISSLLMGVGDSDETIRGFTRSIGVHLHTAVDLVVQQGRRGGIAKAFWELQLACECAFKALLQKTSGTYPRTHDLFYLCDQCGATALGLDRGLIARMPRESEIMDLRYGQASDPTVKSFFRSYRATLAILPPVINPLVQWSFGKARFKVTRPPWMEKVQRGKS